MCQCAGEGPSRKWIMEQSLDEFRWMDVVRHPHHTGNPAASNWVVDIGVRSLNGTLRRTPSFRWTDELFYRSFEIDFLLFIDVFPFPASHFNIPYLGEN